MPQGAEATTQAVRRNAWGIPVVYSVAVLARSAVIVVIPILAYEEFGNASMVSALYLVASLFGLAVSLSFPLLLQSFGTWRLMLCASILGCGAAAALAVGGIGPLALGLALHMLMVQLFEAAINIYAMNSIARRDLTRFEPRRIMLAGLSYFVGPVLGAFLLEFGPRWSPFLLSAFCALLVPLLMRTLTTAVTQAVPPSAAKTSGFAFRQFLRQPRLRLAWSLAIGRAGWWQMFFVYTPIFAATVGISAAQAGTVTGMASAVLLFAPLWGVVLRALGMRRFLLLAYLGCGIATSVAGIVAGWSFGWTIVALIVAAIAISGVDSAGNAPFMRAVKPRERMRMVPVYNTYRELSQILPTGVYTLLLMVFQVGIVFAATGIALTILSLFCLKLPRRA